MSSGAVILAEERAVNNRCKLKESPKAATHRIILTQANEGAATVGAVPLPMVRQVVRVQIGRPFVAGLAVLVAV